MRVRVSAREVFRCEENQVDKVPRNVGLMTRDKSQMWHALCQKGLLWRSEKERKREKKSEKERKREKKSEKERKSRQKRENLNFFLSCFFRQSFLFFLVSSLSLLSLTLSSKNRRRRKVEKKKRSTKHFFVEVVSLSSGEIYDSNAQNRFRMAPRRLDRRSERVFHFQRTVERISRRARKEEYE